MGTGKSERLRGTGKLLERRKQGNQTHWDPVEGREPPSNRGPGGRKMAVRQGPKHISTQRLRIAELARRDRSRVLTALHHYIDLQWLHEAYHVTRKDGAVGIDGVTAQEYQKNLMENLKSLLEGFKSGSYRAPNIKRSYIPKGDGKKRPIGITTFEDKVLQRAVVMVLQEIYEQEFYDFSHGFRPGRSQHLAMKEAQDALKSLGKCWALEVDITGYFDNIDHKHLRSCLDQRVRDGVIRRMIDKWLRAGVMESGQVTYSEVGTPQGGVASPLLSNIFLHYVLDDWFARIVLPRMRGKAKLVRYADDFILFFKEEEDAKRVQKAVRRRFESVGLMLHPEKTQLVRMAPPVGEGGERLKHEERGSLEFLGLTFFWGRHRKGSWEIRAKTSKKRMQKCLKKTAEWCRKNRHRKIRDQSVDLTKKLLGHYQYFGISINLRALWEFRSQVIRIWKYWLSRRSGKKHLSWATFLRKTERFPLPRPKITHWF